MGELSITESVRTSSERYAIIRRHLLPLDTTMETFGEWLAAELHARDWSMSKMGQLCGVTHAAISRVISGENKPSTGLCKSIARAFGCPLEEVYRHAGLLPPLPEQDAVAENALHLFRHLTVADQERILAMMRVLATLSETEGKGER